MQFQSDTLVIGSGIAGLLTAIDAADLGSVTLITKRELSECNTRYAQGGITAVLSPDDTVEAHIADTLRTGNGISNPESVTLLAEGGAKAIERLVSLGTEFSRSTDSKAWHNLDLGREGGHSKHRIVHAQDRTGKAIELALLAQVRGRKEITILEWHTMLDLITDHHCTSAGESNRCYGAYIYNRTSRTYETHLAKRTVLATGGLGEVYEHTTNPTVATGDGIATAWRAGVEIANMEFVQFHPTSLYHPKADSFLISEALRGHGAILKDSEGREFMEEYHEMKSLAPRDIVARAIDREMKTSGEPCAYLDIRHAESDELQERFPKIYANCLKFGIDITRDLIPVVPASHYSCGGIAVDLDGHTSLAGLYAVGEVSCTGVHGANRLASNSLLEAVVFADRAVKAIARDQHHSIDYDAIKSWDDSNTTNTEEWVLISHNRSELQKIMWDYVGIVRSDERLERALRRVTMLRDEIEHFYKRTKINTSLVELRNLATVAELIVRSALQRKESRGLHYTKDYPQKRDAFLCDTVLRDAQ